MLPSHAPAILTVPPYLNPALPGKLASAWAARAVAQGGSPTASTQSNVLAYLTALQKGSDPLNTLDALWAYCVDDVGSAAVDLIGGVVHTVTATLTFTALKSYLGAGGFITTNWNPVTNGKNFKRDNNNVTTLIWNWPGSFVSRVYWAGNNTSNSCYFLNSAISYGYVQNNNGSPTWNFGANFGGLFSANRISSVRTDMNRDGPNSQANTGSVDIGLTSANYQVFNAASGGASTFEIGLFAVGGARSSQQETDFFNATNAFVFAQSGLNIP